MKKKIDPQSGKMRILEDANEYINLQAWARKTIEELGYASTEKLKETIDRAIKQKGALPSGILNTFNIEKLEGMSFILTVELNNWRVGLFMAPGIEAIKHVKKYGQEQRQKREKRQTWKGLTREQRLVRNQSIIENFKEARRKNRSLKASMISASGFAKKHADEYHLKPKQVQNILKLAVGN